MGHLNSPAALDQFSPRPEPRRPLMAVFSMVMRAAVAERQIDHYNCPFHREFHEAQC